MERYYVLEIGNSYHEDGSPEIISVLAGGVDDLRALAVYDYYLEQCLLNGHRMIIVDAGADSREADQTYDLTQMYDINQISEAVYDYIAEVDGEEAARKWAETR